MKLKTMKNNTVIHVPKSIKIILWKNKKNPKIKNIHLIGYSKKIKLLYSKKIFIDKWNNSITLLKKHNCIYSLKLENKINLFLKSLVAYCYNKIKFKGKGFRIKFFKRIKLIKFYFGRSHKTFMLLKKIKRKKINKYKFIVFSVNNFKLKKISKTITDIKKINFYTLRGIKISRQQINKRKGKKGTYI